MGTIKTIPQIKITEINKFINQLPKHSPFTVGDAKGIKLSDMYYSVLCGMNYMIEYANNYLSTNNNIKMAVDDQYNYTLDEELLSFFCGLKSSLNPFISEHKSVNAAKEILLKKVLTQQKDAEGLSAIKTLHNFDDHLYRSLSDTTSGIASAWAREKKSKLSLKYEDYLIETNIQTRKTQKNWDTWYERIVDASILHHAGYAIDLLSFYTEQVAILQKIKVTKDNYVDYYNIVTHISFGMSHYLNRPLKTTEFYLVGLEVTRLSWSLYKFMVTNKLDHKNPETVAEFLDVHKATSTTYNYELFSDVVFTVLNSQRVEGNWTKLKKKPSVDDIYEDYHSCWTCIDGLRPTKHVRLDVNNKDLV